MKLYKTGNDQIPPLGARPRHSQYIVTFLGAGLGAALALGAADGLPAAGRPPEDLFAATGPDDLEAFALAGEDACRKSSVGEHHHDNCGVSTREVGCTFVRAGAQRNENTWGGLLRQWIGRPSWHTRRPAAKKKGGVAFHSRIVPNSGQKRRSRGRYCRLKPSRAYFGALKSVRHRCSMLVPVTSRETRPPSCSF